MTGRRFNAQGAGPEVVAADVAVSAGWGTGPTVTVADGSNDSRGKITIEAEATPAADPTITITFAKAFDSVPLFAICARQDEDQAAGEFRVTGLTATAAVITFEGTPVANEVYEVAYLICE